MQIDENRFETLEKDVRDIKNFLLGDEWRENGIKQRVERNEKELKKWKRRWWIAVGAGGVVFFLLKWGDNFIGIF
ncbi:MAG: hypothetical protein KGY70_19810 [Bacteroidales bacterium]|nr:hypothetical protein [Bacteroidales bacterium]